METQNQNKEMQVSDFDVADFINGKKFLNSGKHKGKYEKEKNAFKKYLKDNANSVNRIKQIFGKIDFGKFLNETSGPKDLQEFLNFLNGSIAEFVLTKELIQVIWDGFNSSHRYAESIYRLLSDFAGKLTNDGFNLILEKWNWDSINVAQGASMADLIKAFATKSDDFKLTGELLSGILGKFKDKKGNIKKSEITDFIINLKLNSVKLSDDVLNVVSNWLGEHNINRNLDWLKLNAGDLDKALNWLTANELHTNSDVMERLIKTFVSVNEEFALTTESLKMILNITQGTDNKRSLIKFICESNIKLSNDSFRVILDNYSEGGYLKKWEEMDDYGIVKTENDYDIVKTVELINIFDNKLENFTLDKETLKSIFDHASNNDVYSSFVGDSLIRPVYQYLILILILRKKFLIRWMNSID